MMGIGRRQIVIELDGVLYGRKGPQIEQVPDRRDVTGAHILISDLQGCMARTMVVESEPRYVELLVARRLQEAGEFDEPVTVVSHWKKKLGRNSTGILFTAVPTRVYLQYRDYLQESDHSVELFPLTALLYQVLKGVAGRSPVAVLFQHGCLVDLIVGSRRRVYMANRYVAYDNSTEQITNLWERIEDDLKETATEHRISVEETFLINWVDADHTPAWSAESGLTLTELEKETLLFHDAPHELSFFQHVGKLSAWASLSGPFERICLLASRLALPLNLTAVILALLLAAGGVFYQRQGAELEKTALQLQADLARQLAAQPPPPSLDNYEAPLNFAQSLDQNQRMPGFDQVLGDLSRAMGRGMRLVDVDARYEGAQLTVVLTGNIKAPFRDAHGSYQRFLNLLQSRHYTVELDQFDTQISDSQFRVRLMRSL